MSQLAWYPGHELLLKDIVRAEGSYLYDSAGKRYVDLESGVWCTSIGHGHPRVRRALTEQLANIAHTGYCYSSDIVEQAAAEVLAVTGFRQGKCVFLCSGSEAVEYGVRVAKELSDRPLLLTLADSYFGAYGSASRRDADEWYCLDWMDVHDVGDAVASIPFSDIGGFLFEPGSSSGLVRFPPINLVEAIVAEVRRNNGLILVNEVTTGIGRTGKWFGYQHYGITPDIVAMGKGIGNGYPVSATAFAPGLIERLDGGTLHYAQSHQNDPLGAAVARAVIRTIQEEGLIERGREIAALLKDGLDAIQRRTGNIREIRARGLMMAIELEDDAQTSRTRRTVRELIRRGYVLVQRPNLNILRLDPSLTVERQDIEGFLMSFEEVLAG